jgi:hypothetical protein
MARSGSALQCAPMTWSEHWPIALADPDLDARAVAGMVEEALVARDLAIGPTIVHESGEIEGVLIECYGRYLSIALGIGELRGTITIARPDGEDAGYAELSSDDVRGPWEPLYALFAELAIELGAEQEPSIAAELDPDELREDLRSTVEACVADAMSADGLTSGDATIAADGDAPLDAFELDVELRADAIVVRVTGAGERFIVSVRDLAVGLPAGLSRDARAEILRALREDLEPCVAAHRWLRHQRTAPPADPARAGRLFLERRAAGRAVSAEELISLDELRRALAEHDADVIRYFSGGEPFWKASYERGHELDELVTSLDELHADRTWQWQARGG